MEAQRIVATAIAAGIAGDAVASRIDTGLRNGHLSFTVHTRYRRRMVAR